MQAFLQLSLSPHIAKPQIVLSGSLKEFLASFPLGENNNLNLSVRFEGELSTDTVTDWFATTVLELPRVFYHTKETLVYIISFPCYC